MRLLLQPGVVLFSLVTTVLATAQTLSLANFEASPQVPKDCSNAWTAPISGCASSDFLPGGSCSSKCIASIQDTARKVTIACQGVAVDPNTLMGLFFEGKGLNAMCPNMVVTTVVGGGSGNGGATTTKGIIIGTSAAAAPSLPSGSTEIMYDTSALLATKSSTSQSTAVSSSSAPPSTPTVPASTNAASISTSSSLTSTTVVITTSITSSITTAALQKTSSTTATTSASTTAVISSTASPTTATSVTSVVTVTTSSSRSVLPLPTVESSAEGNRNAQTHEANPQITGGGGSPFEVSNDGGAKTVPWRIPYILGILLVLWLSS